MSETFGTRLHIVPTFAPDPAPEQWVSPYHGIDCFPFPIFLCHFAPYISLECKDLLFYYWLEEFNWTYKSFCEYVRIFIYISINQQDQVNNADSAIIFLINHWSVRLVRMSSLCRMSKLSMWSKWSKSKYRDLGVSKSQGLRVPRS